LADKNRRDFGIEENLGRDGGIEESYWGPSESSRRLNRRTYMQEYRNKRSIDVIGDENVTELSYRNGRKRKRTCYIREYMEQYRKKKTSDVLSQE